MSMSLLSRITESLLKEGLTPTQEMMTYAIVCDSYAEGSIDENQLQLGLCVYLDQVARRSRAISGVINRVKEPAISEVLTEVTVMWVDAMLRNKRFNDRGWTVSSETSVTLGEGKYVKPDVAIWKDEKIVAVIECKTSLGRSRKEWQAAFEDRVISLGKKGIREESIFLFVATEQCWQGFSPEDPRTLKTWFALCPKNTWFGGGKQGEKKLSDMMHLNHLAKMIQRIEDLHFSKDLE